MAVLDSELIREIIALGAGGIVTAGVTAAYHRIKSGMGLSARVTTLTDAVFALLRINETQSQALLVNLKCLRDGKCNGELAPAIESVEKARTATQEFLTRAALGKRNGKG